MIHKYQLNGYNIVLDINSASVHFLDELSYRLLSSFEEKLPSSCPEAVLTDFSDRKEALAAYDELRELQEKGLLFSDDFTVENLSDYTKNAPIKALCLHIAHDCNLRCSYCFASKGDFGLGKKLMSLETGKAAIDFVLTHSGDRKNIEVDFFGGEPLMNFDVVKELVAYARAKEKEFKKNFRFTITTNGVLLDDSKIEFINKEMSNVVLSLDGRREINDKIRKRIDGGGSYDIIVPKFKKLIETRGDKDYYIRGTFTSYNTDFTEDIKSYLNEGFVQLSLEPAVSDENEPYALREEHIEQVCQEYERLAIFLLEEKKKGNPVNFFHFMIDLKQGPCVIKRLKGCGCGNEYIAVTPDGDIYPCHQFVGKEEFLMGNVHENSINQELKDSFACESVYTKEECGSCFAKYYCSGGCNANNYTYGGSILKPHTLSCTLEKKRIECAIMLKGALMIEE